jgi:hypothetical protein
MLLPKGRANRSFVLILVGLLSVCSALVYADTKTTTTTESKQQQATRGSYLVEICSVSGASLSCVGTVRYTVAITPAAVPAATGDQTCAGLFSSPPSPTATPKPDLSLIVPMLGNPNPYSISVQGKDRILIYSTNIAPNRQLLLASLKNIRDLIEHVPVQSVSPAFSIELTIPHSSSLGDLASKLQTLGYTQLQIADVGYNRVRVTDKTSVPDCDTWRAFLRDTRSLLWQLDPQSPVEKLYYLSAQDVNTAFGGSTAGAASPTTSTASPGSAAGTAAASTAASPATSPGASGQSTGAATAGSAPAAAGTGAATPSAIAAGGTQPSSAAAANGSTTVTVSQPGGTTTVTTTQALPPPSTTATTNTASQATGSSAPTATSAAPAKPATTLAPLGSDLLVFSDANPGDDATVDEKKRILAALDLPRPEMIINAWVTQNSTTDEETFGKVTKVVHRLVNEHNNGLDESIFSGWTYIRRQMVDPAAYFDLPFYQYLTQRVIFDAAAMAGRPSNDSNAGAQRFLSYQDSTARAAGLLTLSIKSAMCSGSTATITTSSPHGLSVGDPVFISGVSVPGYNTAVPATVTAVPGLAQFTYGVTSGLAAGAGGVAIPLPVERFKASAITSVVETGNTATATTNTPHGLSDGDSVFIFGTSVASYSTGPGSVIVTVISPTSFSYSLTTAGVTSGTGGAVYRIADISRHGLDYAGACPFNQYCLGYTTLFQPLEPRLTNLLLAIIAAHNPAWIANCAINYIEGEFGNTVCNYPAHDPPSPSYGLQHVIASKRSEIVDIKKTLEISHLPTAALYASHLVPCEVRDQLGILRYMNADHQYDDAGKLVTLTSLDDYPVRPPRLFLECLRQTMSETLQDPSPSEPSSSPSALGLTRAAVADFLFQYKMSQSYPHEFVPYDLTQSADRFNSALAPLISAFNRDLTAFQGLLRARLQVQMDTLNSGVTFARFFGFDKPTFLNDGIVTVNTVSGNEATVNTTTQSYIDVSTAPSLSSLLSAVAGAGASSGNVGTSHLTTPSPGVLANLTFNQAQVLMGALSAYQGSKAQIGRQLNVDVTPRSLIGASAAELQVTLTADDSASPPVYSSGGMKGSDPEVSRFATNETTTHVRVDSVKLFEVSAFSAVLQNRRPRLPLLPPFVELPYIGTLAGVPLPAAKQFHSSTAILSAVVVPTATDLAYGIRFIADRIVLEGPEPCSWPPPQTTAGIAQPINYLSTRPCKLRHVESLSDFSGQPVREFNRMMVQCLATDMWSPNPSQYGFNEGERQTCYHLTYDKVLGDSMGTDTP